MVLLRTNTIQLEDTNKDEQGQTYTHGEVET